MSGGLRDIDDAQPPNAGFAYHCLIAGAITLAEYQDWIMHLIAADVAVPDYYYDLLDLTDRGDAISMRDRHGQQITARRPTADLSRRESYAVCGIARMRFPEGAHGIENPATVVLAAVTDCPHIVTRFRETFPFLPALTTP